MNFHHSTSGNDCGVSDKPRSTCIAYVLFMDVVGYSRATTTSQSDLLTRLNAAVNACPSFRRSKGAGSVISLPTGDGMALLFTDELFSPANCALEVCAQLRAMDAPVPLRMGIHCGLVQKHLDINGQDNVVGEGINTAQRVMDFGDAGHILLSAQYVLWLQQFDEWLPRIHALGIGIAKNGQQIGLHSLYGIGFGLAKIPTKLNIGREASSLGGVQTSGRLAKAVEAKKIVLLYRRRLQPDEGVLRNLEEQLTAVGHQVFADHHTKIGIEWAETVESRIRAADAVIAIVSPKAMQSEMLEFEIETAEDQYSKSRKPAILPVRIGKEEAMSGIIGDIIRPLNTFVWTCAEDEQKLVVELLSAINEPLKQPGGTHKLEAVGGAIPPDSPFYIRRSCDLEFQHALNNLESILLAKGARQMGKTSLLAQGTRQAKQAGWRFGMTDFQKLTSAQMASEEIFYRLLAATLASQLKFKYDFEAEWDPIFGPNLNLETFLRELLDSEDTPVVWFMDEVDKLFLAPFASDFFGLVRSWHNSRSTEPDGPWRKLTVVIAYATEAHLFIQDLNQSPFNVGRKMELEDFDLQQVTDLNARYNGPLTSQSDVARFYAMIGGQPFLTRRGLDNLATCKSSFETLIEEADRDDGPFNDHLKRMLVSVSKLPEVLENVHCLLMGSNISSREAYYRLLASGVIKQQKDGEITFRCELYERYLRRHVVG